MDWTLLFLIVLLVASFVGIVVVPPLLKKVGADGSIRLFGIKFP